MNVERPPSTGQPATDQPALRRPAEGPPAGAGASRGAHGDPLREKLREQELVRQALRILRSEAARLGRQLGGSVARRELEALGHVALVEIVRAFDPSRGPFAPFATRRLRWALLDALRKESHGRVACARASALESAEARPDDEAAGGGASDEPLAAFRGMLRQRAGTIAAALVAAHGDLADAADSAVSPEQLVARHQAARRLWRAVGQLPAAQRELMERHYRGGEPFGQIAADLGVTRGWASRLHAQAVSALAAALPTM